MDGMLITDHYREQNRILHDEALFYGFHGWRRARKVTKLVRQYGAECVLDYGCGKRTLWRACRRRLDGKVRWQNYDPCIEGLDAAPSPADLVICCDVLEHVEPDCLDEVLDDLRRLSKKAVLLAVATGPGNRTLPDGRNTHLIIESAEWWLPRILQRFQMTRFKRGRLIKEFQLVGVPLY